jgi:hypothetical protein
VLSEYVHSPLRDLQRPFGLLNLEEDTWEVLILRPFPKSAVVDLPFKDVCGTCQNQRGLFAHYCLKRLSQLMSVVVAEQHVVATATVIENAHRYPVLGC